MQKLVEYSNYISNSNPKYEIRTSYNDDITIQKISWGDYNEMTYAYYYNYNEFNKDPNININTYINNIFSQEYYSNNEDFLANMTNAYEYISDELDKHHLSTTFDYYTISYNLLKYSYSTYNSNEKYSNFIKFTYIIDHHINEYDISYSHYCDYLKSWTNDMYNEINTPFYIKILNNNVKIKLSRSKINDSTYQPVKFSCLSDYDEKYTEKDSVEFNNVCYIKDVRLDSADKDYYYTYNLFDFDVITENEDNKIIKCEIGGNILSLLKQDLGLTSYKSFNKMDNYKNALVTYFGSFFKNNSYIYKADKLYIPLLEIGPNMYEGMFSGCKNLTYGPTLLFQNIQENACKDMFNGCSNLSYLTMLTYNYSYNVDETTNVNVKSSHMFDNWINGTSYLNLTLNSNILKHDKDNNQTYFKYITYNSSYISIKYI